MKGKEIVSIEFLRFNQPASECAEGKERQSKDDRTHFPSSISPLILSTNSLLFLSVSSALVLLFLRLGMALLSSFSTAATTPASVSGSLEEDGGKREMYFWELG